LRLRLDENLGHRTAELFRGAGHDVCTVHDQGLMSASDDALYEVCVEERRTLVTLDLHPFRFDPGKGAGIIVLRVGRTPRGHEIEEAGRQSSTAEPEVGQLAGGLGWSRICSGRQGQASSSHSRTVVARSASRSAMSARTQLCTWTAVSSRSSG
jgi:predicted nuclease of predicted toxin-antitoxin system